MRRFLGRRPTATRRVQGRPFATSLTDEATGHDADELRGGTNYRLKGAFFGRETGRIFLQTTNSSTELGRDYILGWSPEEILFKMPAGIAPTALSVNNGALATKYALPTRPSSARPAAGATSSERTAPARSPAGRKETTVFRDVGTDHPYAAAINWAEQSGILQGYPDGTFQPDRAVNRAEFLKIILTAGRTTANDARGETGFPDVESGAWYAPFVRDAWRKGIVRGYPDGTFRPEQTVTVAEALKMAYTALGVPTADLGGDWYEPYLRHARANKVLYRDDVPLDSGMSRKDVVWLAWKLTTHDGGWEEPSAPAPPPTSQVPAATRFGDGTHAVGAEIRAGTYRTRKVSPGCYYARLSGFGGEIEDIVTNGYTDVPALVTISAADRGFESKGCGTWDRVP